MVVQYTSWANMSLCIILLKSAMGHRLLKHSSLRGKFFKVVIYDSKAFVKLATYLVQNHKVIQHTELIPS